jgi:hypothetical protein
LCFFGAYRLGHFFQGREVIHSPRTRAGELIVRGSFFFPLLLLVLFFVFFVFSFFLLFFFSFFPVATDCIAWQVTGYLGALRYYFAVDTPYVCGYSAGLARANETFVPQVRAAQTAAASAPDRAGEQMGTRGGTRRQVSAAKG